MSKNRTPADQILDLSENRYKLSTLRHNDLITQVRQVPAEVRGGLRIVELAGSESVSDLGRELEQQIFDSVFGDTVPHTPELMTSEYGPYEDASQFYVVLDEASREVAGVLRTLQGSKNKTLDDLRTARLITSDKGQHPLFDRETTWDLGTVAVSPASQSGGRRSLVSIALYRALFSGLDHAEAVHWTAILDVGVLPIFDELGVPYSRIEDIADMNYLGSNARACFGRVGDIRDAMMSRSRNADHETRTTITAILNGSPMVPELANLGRRTHILQSSA